MMKKMTTIAVMAALAQGCSKPAPKPAQKAPAVAVSPKAAPQPAPRPTPPKQAPTIDPKSNEAALDVLDGLVRLLNQRRFNEAYMLLGAAAPPRADFDSALSRYSDLKVSVGNPGDQEGAAGSIYLSVPLSVSGISDGKHVSRSATAILRRVNDVPGSTEAQRHWHIERIDWGNGA